MNVSQYLEWAEGKTNDVYLDTEGYPTVGIGHKLGPRSYTDEEVSQFFEEDMRDVYGVCENLSYWDDLNDVRKCVVASLIFNVGWNGFLKFVKFRSALAHGNYYTAAEELKDSKRHRQIGRRGEVEYQMMRTGEWQELD